MALLLVAPAGALASHLARGSTERGIGAHTVLASNIVVQEERPTDFASLAGLAFHQRRNECVVWFNGIVIFDGTVAGDHNAVNDNAADPCGKERPGFLVMGTESGDCDPRLATIHPADVEFVRDLPFLDPNGQAHLVAELRFSCGTADLGGDVLASPGCAFELVNGDDQGCGQALHRVDDTAALVAPDPDLRSLFKEYVWVTVTHPTVLDPTLDDGACTFVDPLDATNVQDVCHYNFALVLDTCNDDPRNATNDRSPTQRCTDGGGKEFLGIDSNGDGNTTNDPEDRFAEARFDDTPRGVVVHDREPSTTDEIRDGNSSPDTTTCGSADDHREDRTSETGSVCDTFGETDYTTEQDHLSAQVDLLLSPEGCAAPVTPVGAAFCAALAAGLLTPQVVNHPGCTTSSDGTDDDADCTFRVTPPNDVPGAAGPNRLDASQGNPYGVP